MMMRNLFLLLFAAATFTVSAQTPWSYVQQGTPDWPGAVTKDLLVSGDSIFAFGDIGLIDIEEGALTFTKLSADGEPLFAMQYDKPGVLEIAQRVTRHPDHGFLTSSMLAPGYRPYFTCIGWDGEEVWNSSGWSDALPENSASQTYAYALPSGEVACVVADDVMRTLTRYLVNAADGSLISTTTENYADIIPYDPADLISSSTADFTHDDDGNCVIIAGFNVIGTDTTDFIFQFDADFTFTFRRGIANTTPQLALHSVIINSLGQYIVAGSENTGAFFDLYTPVIITVDDWWTATQSYDHPLPQATSGPIVQTDDGGYKWIWYNYSGAFYDPAVGDYMSVVTLDASLLETATTTIQYAPYDIIECIAAAPSAPAVDDAYVMGGMSWEIGVPAYQTVIASGAADALPACIFNCVWPGDADNSGVADMDDLLAIGLGFGSTGPARDAVDISWTAHAAEEWATALPGDINHKYTDCNGDGVIDAADEDAVDLNYGFEHEVYTLKTSGGDVPLYFAPTGPLEIGFNSVPIFLGNDMYPVEEIYGIRFTALATGESVDAASVGVAFNDSWIGAAASMLQLSKNSGVDASAAGGLVKTDQENASGFGQIGTLNFVVIDNIAGKLLAEEITLDFAGVRAITVTGEELALAPEAFTAEVTVSTNDIAQEEIKIYPNPVSGNSMQVSADISSAVVTLMDMMGRAQDVVVSTSQTIQLPELPNGEYLLRIVTDRATTIVPVSIQH